MSEKVLSYVWESGRLVPSPRRLWDDDNPDDTFRIALARLGLRSTHDMRIGRAADPLNVSFYVPTEGGVHPTILAEVTTLGDRSYVVWLDGLGAVLSFMGWIAPIIHTTALLGDRDD